MAPPRLVVLDVNETLSDLGPMRHRFADAGLAETLVATWFAQVLRDGFSLSTLGTSSRFADLGRDVLHDLAPDLDEDAVDHVLAGFSALDLHPDVAPGLRAFSDAGTTVVTLSNGSTDVAEGLLARAGVRDLVDHVLSVDDVGVWKPHPRAYAHALRTCDVSPADALMVAVHPWDLHGAAHAGLDTAWITRDPRAWPSAFTPPTHRAEGLDAVAGLVRDS
ncbi:haloacid dehalogenase type II [Nocardioidaceae bacterium]|nr:haloacid dehalogenase type II [Nocardioidaceae bacterium]